MNNAWGATDIGMKRRENQDSYAIERFPNGEVIGVVCDGMGGASGGQIASRIAVDTFMEQIRALLNPDMTPQQLRELMVFSVSQANAAVYRRALEDAACRGMGTTLVAAMTWAGCAIVCNVGDSRAYHFGADAMTRVTHDHSVVQRMVDSGEITPEEARSHPSRNLITRALGPEFHIDCDTYETALEEGDRILLCSDGLVITVTDGEMWETVRASDGCAQSLERLILLSRERGAPDNVTAVLIQKG